MGSRAQVFAQDGRRSGATAQRDRGTNDLYAERQAIHRRSDGRLQSTCRTYRVVPALTQTACITGPMASMNRQRLLIKPGAAISRF